METLRGNTAVSFPYLVYYFRHSSPAAFPHCNLVSCFATSSIVTVSGSSHSFAVSSSCSFRSYLSSPSINSLKYTLDFDSLLICFVSILFFSSFLCDITPNRVYDRQQLYFVFLRYLQILSHFLTSHLIGFLLAHIFFLTTFYFLPFP